MVHHSAMRILFFAHLREISGTESAEIDGDRLDGARLWELLEHRWPRLASYRSDTRLARNGSYVAAGEIFDRDDEVALIPPVSGG